MNIVDLPAVCTLKGNGISLTFKDVWNVLELLQETKHQNILHYSTRTEHLTMSTMQYTYCIESTLSHNDFVQQCSYTPNIHFIIVVL